MPKPFHSISLSERRFKWLRACVEEFELRSNKELICRHTQKRVIEIDVHRQTKQNHQHEYTDNVEDEEEKRKK